MDNAGNIIITIDPKELELKWVFFYGTRSGGGAYYDNYYSTEIDGKRVEKHANNRGITYTIGNHDTALTKFSTELDLILAVKKGATK